MTHAALSPLIGPEFDDFLGASIGEDRNGTGLSVLSALGRIERFVTKRPPLRCNSGESRDPKASSHDDHQFEIPANRGGFRAGGNPQFRSVSEAGRGLRTEFRPFLRVLRLKSRASLSPQISVSRTMRWRGRNRGLAVAELSAE